MLLKPQPTSDRVYRTTFLDRPVYAGGLGTLDATLVCGSMVAALPYFVSAFVLLFSSS